MAQSFDTARVNFDRYRGNVNVCSPPKRLPRAGDALGPKPTSLVRLLASRGLMLST